MNFHMDETLFCKAEYMKMINVAQRVFHSGKGK